MADEPSYLDEIHQDIAEFAERHLEEDERADFIDGLLERHGYQKQAVWAPPQQDPKGGKKGVLPQNKSKKPPYFRG